MAWRCDTVPIAKTEVTPEGYLRCWGRIAKPGIQVYKDSTGKERREYRPESEVSDPESLVTWGGKAVTDEHPPELLTASNTSRFQKGFTGNEVRYSDGFVSVVLTVTDQSLIDKINRGDAQELSCGYQVAADYTPGEAPGLGHYDAVQRKIRGNHLAVVQRGRAGPSVRLLLDSLAESGEADLATMVGDSESIPQEKQMDLVKLRLDSDGHSTELDVSAAALPLLTARLDADRARIAQLESELVAAQEENAACMGRADGLEAALAELREVQDAMPDEDEEGDEPDEDEDEDEDEAARVARKVAKRVKLLDSARSILDADMDLLSMSDREIQIAAIEKVLGSSFNLDEDQGEEYIQGVFDSLHSVVTAAKDERSDAYDTLTQALKRVAPGSSRQPTEKKEEKPARWQRPLTASRASK